MSPNDSKNIRRKYLNDRNHVLDLSTGIRMHIKSRLYDKDRKIRNYALFFRLDGTLPTNGLTRKTTEPIPAKKTTQLTQQPIPIEEGETRSR
jgi:hypothetical protein